MIEASKTKTSVSQNEPAAQSREPKITPTDRAGFIIEALRGTALPLDFDVTSAKADRIAFTIACEIRRDRIAVQKAIISAQIDARCATENAVDLRRHINHSVSPQDFKERFLMDGNRAFTESPLLCPVCGEAAALVGGMLSLKDGLHIESIAGCFDVVAQPTTTPPTLEVRPVDMENTAKCGVTMSVFCSECGARFSLSIGQSDGKNAALCVLLSDDTYNLLEVNEAAQ